MLEITAQHVEIKADLFATEGIPETLQTHNAKKNQTFIINGT